jgi:hypothetical protein
MRMGRNQNPCKPLVRRYNVASVMEMAWRVLENLKTETPYDPALPGIHPKELKTGPQRHVCTSMFITALLPRDFIHRR